MNWQRNYLELKDGQRVRFSLITRPGSNTYLVRFLDRRGVRVERSTGCGKKAPANDEAQRLILAEYGRRQASAPVSWADAEATLQIEMEADRKRPRTYSAYLQCLKLLKQHAPNTPGPSSITEVIANEFRIAYSKGRYTRQRRLKKGEQPRSYARRPETLASRLRMLKAVFGWFKRLGFISSNVFENIELPEIDRREVKYVDPADVADFFQWLSQRYPGWKMPRLFFSAKAVTGCRLLDLCSLRSEQLRDGRLVFPADVTKNRSERYAILPKELYEELTAYKGKTYLWERYPAELIEANRVRNHPIHRQNTEFTPHRLYVWIMQLMGYYRKAGRHFTSHDFRRAAFTRAAERDIHVKRAAAAFDVTAETMLRYYTATEKKKTADEVLTRLADDLLPIKNGGKMVGFGGQRSLQKEEAPPEVLTTTGLSMLGN